MSVFGTTALGHDPEPETGPAGVAFRPRLAAYLVDLFVHYVAAFVGGICAVFAAGVLTIVMQIPFAEMARRDAPRDARSSASSPRRSSI